MLTGRPATVRGSSRLGPARTAFAMKAVGAIATSLPVPPMATRLEALGHLFGAFNHVVDQVAEFVAHRIGDGNSLFEHVSDEVRNGDPQFLGRPAKILLKLLGDPRVENPPLPALPRAFIGLIV